MIGWIINDLRKLQSLFYWKSFCNVKWSSWSNGPHGVTILILLEIILQHERQGPMFQLYTRYNPYFIGNHSATLERKSGRPCQQSVTILILLEIILQRNTPQPPLCRRS